MLRRGFMKKLRLSNRHGFTLVELALVLVIVGLLITGVLKGEALIQNAKVKKLVNQKESLAAAYYTFYDRYSMYPGDENSTTFPTSDAHNGDGDGRIEANLNEHFRLFEDLELSGIINGSYNGTNQLATNAFGGDLSIEWGTHYTVQDNWATFTNIPNDVTEMIDIKYDDGIYNTGSIRANQVYTNTAAKTLWWRM